MGHKTNGARLVDGFHYADTLLVGHRRSIPIRNAPTTGFSSFRLYFLSTLVHTF